MINFELCSHQDIYKNLQKFHDYINYVPIYYFKKHLNIYKNGLVFFVALFSVLYIYEKKKILIFSRVIVNEF